MEKDITRRLTDFVNVITYVISTFLLLCLRHTFNINVYVAPCTMIFIMLSPAISRRSHSVSGLSVAPCVRMRS